MSIMWWRRNTKQCVSTRKNYAKRLMIRRLSMVLLPKKILLYTSKNKPRMPPGTIARSMPCGKVSNTLY